MQGKEVGHSWEIGAETLMLSEICLYWVAHLDAPFSASELKEEALLTKEQFRGPRQQWSCLSIAG